MVGSFGDITCFSFYANKTITTGEGGMLVTDDEQMYKRVKTMRLHGINRDIWDRFTAKVPSWEYDVEEAGYKYNTPDVTAAIGLGQLEQAESYYLKALKLNADDVYAHNNLGQVYARQNRLEDAENCFQRALELDRTDLYAHNNLGKLMERTDRIDEARREFELALQIDSGDAYARNNLGRIMAKQGDQSSAVAQFRAVLEEHPDDAVAYHNLGRVHAQQGLWQEAVSYYSRALELSPHDSYARNNLGRALLSLGRVGEAEQEFRRSLVADENYVRDAILLPRKDVVAGFDPIMPSFAGQLGEDDLAALIAYLRSTVGARGPSAGSPR